jgi:uncharacterized glyoxalase superfamily protein PhnB
MDKVTTSEFAASAIPVLRYRDLPAAIEWLCTALGFSRHHVVTGAKGVIIFAQLTLGKAMIMVGPVRQSAFDKFLKQPDEIDGAETQVCYFFVVDAHAHCARAKAAGAKIIFDIEDKANGGRSYSCRDPEGHLWNFGTYDPWRRRVVAHRQPSRMGWGCSRRVAALCLFIGVLATITGLALAPNIQHKLGATLPADRPAENEVKMALDGLARERTARQAAERAEQEMRDRLTDARGAQATQHLRQLLAAERNRRRMAEKATQEASHRLAEAQNAKDAAEQVAKEAHERLARMQLRKGAAERAASQAKRQLAMERNAKRAAEGQFTGSLPTATTTLPW